MTFFVFAVAVRPLAARFPKTTSIFSVRRGARVCSACLGEVQRPGEYASPMTTDVLELISKAGGPTEFAKHGRRFSAP